MSVKRVSPQEANDLRQKDGYLYLDVRSIPEFEQGHPAGAFNVPLLHFTGGRMMPNPQFMEIVGKAFPSDAKIVVGCKSGGRSLRAAEMMASAGFSGVIDMRGGFHGEYDRSGACTMPGWADSKLPVATTAETGKSYAELTKK